MKRREIHGLLWGALGLLATATLVVPCRAQTGVVDGCQSSSSCWTGAIVVCPAGDGHALRDQGATIFVTAIDFPGNPIPGIAAADWWLIGCNSGLALCTNTGSIDADGITDSNGQTSIGGAIKAGGCDTGLAVVLQTVNFTQWPACAVWECHPIAARSPDINGDLIVDIVDFSIWAPSFLEPGAPPCHDFSFDGEVDVIDFSIFGAHFLHACQ